MQAIDEGVLLVGASSMGALRAAEMLPFGMVGAGRVFESFRDGELDGDDEVALVHGPAESLYRPLSEPLVNIRYTVAAAVASGLHSDVGAALVREAKDVYYPERSLRSLVRSNILSELADDVAHSWRESLLVNRVDIKASDALEALRCRYASPAVRASSARRSPLGVGESESLGFRVFRTTNGTMDGFTILARLDESLSVKLRNELIARWFLLSWARRRGFEPTFRGAGAVGPQNGLTRSERRDIDRERFVVAQLRADANTLLRRGVPLRDEQECERAFIVDWALMYGVRRPRSDMSDKEFADWMIDQSPTRFGFRFNLAAAALRELAAHIGPIKL